MKRQEDTPLPRGSETVLLVDAEPQARKLAAFMLIRQGYTVLEAHNGEEALRIFGAQGSGIDLLLTEVLMSRMSGHVLAGKLASTKPGLRILYMSDAEYSRAVRQIALEPGRRFLRKPFTMRTLAGKVRQVLDAPIARTAGAPL